MKNIVTEINAVEQERNRLIHSTHAPIEDDPSTARIQKVDLRRKGMKFQDQPMTAEEIETLASRMWSVHNRLVAFIHGMYERNHIQDESGRIRPGFYE